MSDDVRATIPSGQLCPAPLLAPSPLLRSAASIAVLLGLDLTGLNVPIGLSCSSITVVGNNCGGAGVTCVAQTRSGSSNLQLLCEFAGADIFILSSVASSPSTASPSPSERGWNGRLGAVGRIGAQARKSYVDESGMVHQRDADCGRVAARDRMFTGHPERREGLRVGVVDGLGVGVAVDEPRQQDTAFSIHDVSA
ncbi:hypothetical protein C8R43DRAFT_1138343 [Mycena crocata]|nr:hypothetical protein C8R43DRAFT_1138343 [Mycena crocata]